MMARCRALASAAAISSPRRRARRACISAVALFGFAGLFGKWIAWDPVAIVLGRTAIAALVLGLRRALPQGRVAAAARGAWFPTA